MAILRASRARTRPGRPERSRFGFCRSCVRGQHRQVAKHFIRVTDYARLGADLASSAARSFTPLGVTTFSGVDRGACAHSVRRSCPMALVYPSGCARSLPARFDAGPLSGVLPDLVRIARGDGRRVLTVSNHGPAAEAMVVSPRRSRARSVSGTGRRRCTSAWAGMPAASSILLSDDLAAPGLRGSVAVMAIARPRP